MKGGIWLLLPTIANYCQLLPTIAASGLITAVTARPAALVGAIIVFQSVLVATALSGNHVADRPEFINGRLRQHRRLFANG